MDGHAAFQGGAPLLPSAELPASLHPGYRNALLPLPNPCRAFRDGPLEGVPPWMPATHRPDQYLKASTHIHSHPTATPGRAPHRDPSLFGTGPAGFASTAGAGTPRVGVWDPRGPTHGKADAHGPAVQGVTATPTIAAGEAARAAARDLHTAPRTALIFSRGGPFVPTETQQAGGPASLMKMALDVSMGPMLAAMAEEAGMLAPSPPPVPYPNRNGVQQMFLCSYLGTELTRRWALEARELAVWGAGNVAGDPVPVIRAHWARMLANLRGEHAFDTGNAVRSRWRRDTAAITAVPVRVPQDPNTPWTNPHAHDEARVRRQLHVVHKGLLQEAKRALGIMPGEGVPPSLARGRAIPRE